MFEERSGGLSSSKTPPPNLICTTYSKTQCFQLFPGRVAFNLTDSILGRNNLKHFVHTSNWADGVIVANFYKSSSQFSQKMKLEQHYKLTDRNDWSYFDLSNRVNEIAAVLLNRDVRVGDRVSVQVEKSPEALALYLAVLKIGAVHVPLNTAYTDMEVDYFIKDSEPALLWGKSTRSDCDSLTF